MTVVTARFRVIQSDAASNKLVIEARVNGRGRIVTFDNSLDDGTHGAMVAAWQRVAPADRGNTRKWPRLEYGVRADGSVRILRITDGSAAAVVP